MGPRGVDIRKKYALLQSNLLISPASSPSSPNNVDEGSKKCFYTHYPFHCIFSLGS